MNSLIELSESIGNVYIGNNIKKTFYTPEEIEISFDYNSSRVVYNEKKDNPIDLTSFNNTLVFNLDFNYYHFLIDQLSFLLIELIKNNNLQVVFFTNNKIQNYMDYVFEKLEKYNINFYLFILESNESIKVNNYYIYNRENFNFNNQIEIDSLLVSNFLKENKEIKPSRKVYISRKFQDKKWQNSNNYFLKTKNDYFEYKKSNYVNYRMDNYKYLEDFFEKYNFEIIDNINEFYAFSENFIDQINFFNEVKTLISVTGAGLTNAIFMQKDTNVLELATPFNEETFEEKIKYQDINSYYFELCCNLNINYFGISNLQKNALIIEEKFLKNPYLFNILNN